MTASCPRARPCFAVAAPRSAPLPKRHLVSSRGRRMIPLPCSGKPGPEHGGEGRPDAGWVGPLRFLVTSGKPLGPVRRTPGDFVGPLRGVSGHLAVSWGGALELSVGGPPLGLVLGPSWGSLGPSWAPLGPSWGPLGGLLGRLGAPWAVLERSSGPRGPSWYSLGDVFGRPGASET